MDIREYIKNNRLILDGGMGGLLQQRGLKPGEMPEQWNIIHADIVTDILKEFVDAGSQVLLTNTFGLNSLKYSHDEIEEIAMAAIRNAKAANPMFIAYDMGPCGRMLKPWGDLDFEDAVEIFKEQALLAEAGGADLIIIETMSDSYETKAALLAVKENTHLPVFVSNAYGSDGKLLTGASPCAMVAMLEGLGADAIGANCSLGPAQLYPVMQELAKYASVPLYVKPNAGLPSVRDGKTVYDISAEEFAKLTASMNELGVSIFGGCCGTGAQHIRLLSKELEGRAVRINAKKSDTIVSSYCNAVVIGDGHRPVIIGERINPSGNKKLRQAIENNDSEFILKLGLDQDESGSDVLDVNMGLPGTDELSNLENIVKELQAVTACPLQIDSSNTLAMEKAARIYNGKPLLNSVNGKEENLKAVLPIAAKYGGVLVCLCLDENGIPSDAEERFKIAERIVRRAAEYGIEKKNLIFDALTMPVSADKDSAKLTLDTLAMIHDRLGCASVLGVSNVSFGLPKRPRLNSSFFTMALSRGLSAGIINPMSEDMMNAYHAYCALSGYDEGFEKYINFANVVLASESVTSAISGADDAESLQTAIIKGLKSKAEVLTKEYLKNHDPLEIINGHIIPALDLVGKGYEDGSIYLPQLLLSAEAAKESFEALKNSPAMQNKSQDSERKSSKFVIATVKGDIHDIGKNIVKLLLSNYGFDVIDLGKDVAPKDILDAIEKSGAKLCGLSALMTTTVPAMEESIKLIKEKQPLCKIIVGGAVLNEEYAKSIGADYYAKDAMSTVRFAQQLV